jgi:hypothetical protein
MGQSEILGMDEILGELLGDDEAVLGGDDLAVLGAALRASSPRAKSALSKAIMARKIGKSAMVVKREPRSSGVQPLGFFFLNIAAGAQVIVTTQPQVLYKPERLVVPTTIAPFFTIDDILVGNKSQFPSANPLPAEMFIPNAEAVVLELETVNPAINLSLRVTNISGAQQNFRAGFVGRNVD